MVFVVDYLIHIAKKPLGWKTSSKILNGDGGDISPFRFKFWESIKFYTAKQPFPKSRQIKGGFSGIAWETGDRP